MVPAAKALYHVIIADGDEAAALRSAIEEWNVSLRPPPSLPPTLAPSALAPSSFRTSALDSPSHLAASHASATLHSRLTLDRRTTALGIGHRRASGDASHRASTETPSRSSQKPTYGPTATSRGSASPS